MQDTMYPEKAPSLRMILFKTPKFNVPKPGSIVLVDKIELANLMNEAQSQGRIVKCMRGLMRPEGGFTINSIEKYCNALAGLAARIVSIDLIEGVPMTILETPYIHFDNAPLRLLIPYDDTVVVDAYVTDDVPYKYGSIKLGTSIYGIDVMKPLTPYESYRIVDLGFAEFDEVSVDYWNANIKRPDDVLNVTSSVVK